jgi:dihydrodipicolinate reductase
MSSVRARTVFSDHGLTVTAVESVEFRTDRSNRRRFVFGSVRPVAVIVREPDRTYALDMDAQPVNIERMDLPDDFDLE